MSSSPEPTPPPNRRADYLGSTALTVRLRCPCGTKNDFDRQQWQWRQLALCRRCGAGILHPSLRVVDAAEADRLLAAQTPTDTELRSLYHVELVARDFITAYDLQPRWLWAQATVELADKLKRLFRALDEERSGGDVQLENDSQSDEMEQDIVLIDEPEDAPTLVDEAEGKDSSNAD